MGSFKGKQVIAHFLGGLYRLVGKEDILVGTQQGFEEGRGLCRLEFRGHEEIMGDNICKMQGQEPGQRPELDMKE